jgi:hypothetical protein
MAAIISGSREVIFSSSSSIDADITWERILNAERDRYGFPNRGNDKRCDAMDGSDYPKRLEFSLVA